MRSRDEPTPRRSFGVALAWRALAIAVLALPPAGAPAAASALPAVNAAPANESITAIDGARSFVRFSLRIAWLRRLEGVFERIDGEVRRAADGRHVIDVRIPLAGLSMGNPDHERWARSREFFDSERYPWIAFHAAQVPEALLRDGGELQGELMLRGVRQLQTLQIEPSDCARPGRDCPLRAEAELRRSAFGMGARRLIVGDRVRLRFSILLEAGQ